MESLDWPLAPLPPWTLLLLIGDILVFSLLFMLRVRQQRCALRAEHTGDRDSQALHQRKAGMYMTLIYGAALITAVPYLLWLIAVYAVPGSVLYTTSLPLILGVLIWMPFLVWLTPLAALVVELLGRELRG